MQTCRRLDGRLAEDWTCLGDDGAEWLVGYLGSVVVYRNFVTYGTDCCVMCRYCFFSDSELRMIKGLTRVKFDSPEVVSVTFCPASLRADEVVYGRYCTSGRDRGSGMCVQILVTKPVTSGLSCEYSMYRR